MSDVRPKGRFFLALSTAIAFSAFLGFYFTYFSPLFAGQYPEVSPAVHIHGWSFFAWYLLLPIQAVLIRSRRISVHRTLGVASVGLAAVMFLTGLLVVSVRVAQADVRSGTEFWRFFGPVIFSTLLLFVGFYVAALATRRRGPYHKRFIVLASCGALGAATFRILQAVVGFALWVPAVGILLPNLFVVVAMIRDRIRDGEVHPAYRFGLPATLVVEAGVFGATILYPGHALTTLLGWTGEALSFLY